MIDPGNDVIVSYNTKLKTSGANNTNTNSVDYILQSHTWPERFKKSLNTFNYIFGIILMM